MIPSTVPKSVLWRGLESSLAFANLNFCIFHTALLNIVIVLHICSRIRDLPNLFLGQKRKSYFVQQHFYNKSIATAGQGCLHCLKFARLLVLALYCCLLGERVSAYVGTFLVAFLQLLPAFLQLAVDQLFCPIPSRSWLKEPKHLSQEEWRPLLLLDAFTGWSGWKGGGGGGKKRGNKMNSQGVKGFWPNILALKSRGGGSGDIDLKFSVCVCVLIC